MTVIIYRGLEIPPEYTATKVKQKAIKDVIDRLINNAVYLLKGGITLDNTLIEFVMGLNHKTVSAPFVYSLLLLAFDRTVNKKNYKLLSEFKNIEDRFLISGRSMGKTLSCFNIYQFQYINVLNPLKALFNGESNSFFLNIQRVYVKKSWLPAKFSSNYKKTKYDSLSKWLQAYITLEIDQETLDYIDSYLRNNHGDSITSQSRLV